MGATKKMLMDIEERAANIVHGLRDKILSLPDNPKITRLEAAMAIPASELFSSDNWSVMYHDFRAQYAAISDTLEDKNPLEVVALVDTMIKTGMCFMACGGGIKRPHRLNPRVVEHIKGLWDAE